MVTYGLDIYHARYNPPEGLVRSWSSGAGQWNGQFLPPVFAAALLRDSFYANNLRQVADNVHADEVWLRGPSELRQINPGQHGVHLWGDEAKIPEQKESDYWGNLLRSQCFDGATGDCNPGFGARTQRDPYGYIDGPANRPGDDYAGITGGVQRALVATMFLMPEVCGIINHRPLVEYVDRLHNHGIHTSLDACAGPDPREDFDTCNPFSSRDTRCEYYRVTWGPDPANPGQCIRGAGRFTQYDQRPIRLLYTSHQVEANWEQLRGTDAFCRLPDGNEMIQAVY
ncbi:hypothetical protein CAI21_09885 [Alkalilimnicola ehrlichii]|uniref:Uncharacterized protein n=1 Tax=Alkalilimnicola ehrlichii TaxID=351052 RepID=A0A3E0WWX2_9GAMM|nr:hypothetical protein [Alkalilimnicola ehrlichii]RFA29367.1 hypothetical protein CAI21_09885 [Alkalilimnicola ehrlichii]RFA36879.1 hypothetical protein CAL65_10210 [Alkalilimnicola ehrlichii]